YDVGTIFAGNRSTREEFDPAVMRREIEIIRNDLHCNAVRVCGQDIGRLRATASYALTQGLTVWFSPLLVEATEEETLEYLAECSEVAEALRQTSPNILLCVGGELSFYMKGILKGDDSYARIRSFISPVHLLWHMLTGKRWPGRKLTAFLRKAVAVARERFHGQVSYASGPWERVDWRLFDVVGVNYYRDAQNARWYRQGLRAYYQHGKPVAITEFGCCTYEGAEAKGAAGWAIIDTSSKRRKVKPGFRRSEDTQASYLRELLELFRQEPIESTFVFNFASYNLPSSPDPTYDLDMASYGVVNVLPAGEKGTTYPDMPWEPKKAFGVVAEAYQP
ncbi:MAG TPA: abortive infection protein, partial [Ktedonobacterales bacterium]